MGNSHSNSHNSDSNSHNSDSKIGFEEFKHVLIRTIIGAVKDDRLDAQLRADIISTSFALLCQVAVCDATLDLAKSIMKKKPSLDDVVTGLIVMGLEMTGMVDKEREKLRGMVRQAREESEERVLS
jgi:hypothetical protein